MKVVWLNLSEAPDFTKLRSIAATGIAWDIRDPKLNRTYLQGIRTEGFTPYVYSTPHWPETKDMDGVEFAEWTHRLLDAIAPRTGNAMPCVCFDIEYHDAPFVRSCLQRWRQLRPTRITDWTLESFQFGWEDAAGFHNGWAAGLVTDVVTYDVLVAPQFYYGPGPLGPDMTPADPAQAILNAVKGGCPVDRLIGMYDAALLRVLLPDRTELAVVDAWRGYAFTQGRIK